MKKKINLSKTIGLVMLACVLTFFVTSLCFQSFYGSSLTQSVSRNKNYSKVYKVDDLLRSKFYSDIDETKLQDGMLTGMVAGVQDRYTMYLDKENFAAIYSEVNGQSQGLGISVTFDEASGYPKIVNVESASGAAEVGILPGDYLVKIADEDCKALGYYASLDKLKGNVGSTAEITISRGGERIPHSVKRKVFQKEIVKSRCVDDTNVGYIKISSFDKGAAEAFSAALDNLKAQNVNGIIFDVRDNPGGELENVCEMLDLLLPEGPIVNINYKDHKEVKSSDANKLDLPMAVLTNGRTYSAAELFAAAIKDYGVGKVVGEKSYGKGKMQSIIPLSDGTGVNITVATFDPPKSPNFDGVGVIPDIEVTLPESVLANYFFKTDAEDTQLAAALLAVLTPAA